MIRINIRRQLLYRSSLGLVSALTILIWLLLGSSLLGYRLVSVHGTSMEPALREGDAILMKYREPFEIETGDIVTLQDSSQDWITHRVITVQFLKQEDYLLKTKGGHRLLSRVVGGR